jgi:hypothetical protein
MKSQREEGENSRKGHGRIALGSNRVSGFRESRDRVACQRNSRNREERKAESRVPSTSRRIHVMEAERGGRASESPERPSISPKRGNFRNQEIIREEERVLVDHSSPEKPK